MRSSGGLINPIMGGSIRAIIDTSTKRASTAYSEGQKSKALRILVPTALMRMLTRMCDPRFNAWAKAKKEAAAMQYPA